jgi:hypothetical protein
MSLKDYEEMDQLGQTSLIKITGDWYNFDSPIKQEHSGRKL